jgi:protein-tyrosine phosphatase
VTFCPGKQGDSVFGAPWQRSLSLDLDVIQAWGARIVVTLIEAHEMAMLSVTDIGERTRERQISWLHLPIRDLQPPGPDLESVWPSAAEALCQTLSAGGNVLVHCRGGLGRVGTVAGCLLVEMGLSPQEAIQRVRQARSGAIETAAQEQYVLGFKASWPIPKAD